MQSEICSSLSLKSAFLCWHHLQAGSLLRCHRLLQDSLFCTGSKTSSSAPAFTRLHSTGLTHVTLMIPAPAIMEGDDICPRLGCLPNHGAKIGGQSHPNLRLWQGQVLLKIRLQLLKDRKLDTGLAETRNAFYKTVYICSFSYFLDINLYIYWYHSCSKKDLRSNICYLKTHT